MSVLVLWVDGEPHCRNKAIRDQATHCSCGRMSPAMGSSSEKANAWRAHVEAEARAKGVEVVKDGGGKVLRSVKPRPVLCGSCGWQGLRETPWASYLGPAGPCPKCQARVFAVHVR